MDVSVSVSLFHGELASAVEHAVKAAVDTVLREIAKSVGGSFAEKDKENEKLRLRLEMSERELKAMRERLMAVSAARSPPPTVNVHGNRTVESLNRGYGRAGLSLRHAAEEDRAPGTRVPFTDRVTDPRAPLDSAFGAELRHDFIDDLTKESPGLLIKLQDEIGERTIKGNEAGWADLDAGAASVERGAARVKEDTEGSACVKEEAPDLQSVEVAPLHLMEEALELNSATAAQERHAPAHSRGAKLSEGGMQVPHPCPDCGKRFVELGPLKRHQRAHARKTPYPCGECGKRFSQKGALRDHLRIHTGEKPFRCPECGRSFTRVDGLQIHLRIHTGEKPYRCGACGKRFRHSAGLKQHSQAHARGSQREARRAQQQRK